MAARIKASIMITCLGDMFFPEVGVLGSAPRGLHGDTRQEARQREKVIPSMTDLVVFLAILARSAAGQKLSSYNFIPGPSRTADIDLTLTRGVHGPKDVHAIFVAQP